MDEGLRILPLRGIPEIRPEADLCDLLLRSTETIGGLVDGDILVIAQKAVSKAEGRLVALASVTASPFAVEYAATFEKDPRHVEVVLREARRVVRMDHGVLIVETKHGLICANAGVDASNLSGEHMVCLLPDDPDASATRIAASVAARTGVRVAVVISDTFGRPWREGLTN